MTTQEYIDELKLELTGGILELEMPDSTIDMVLNKAFRELKPYIDETRLITIPYADCIDVSTFPHTAIIKLYRTEGYRTSSSVAASADPMAAQQWLSFSNGGTMYNLQNYILNFMAVNTLAQIENTMSTDLSFKEDKQNKKLYPNVSGYGKPDTITIEYVPIYESLEEIESEYWVNILQKLALAHTKIILGRIRTRFTQSNGLWSDDGATILQEGNEELKELRDKLDANSTYFYPIK